MNRHALGDVRGTALVDRFAKQVEHAPQHAFSHGYGHGLALVEAGLAAPESIRRAEGDTTNLSASHVSGDLPVKGF